MFKKKIKELRFVESVPSDARFVTPPFNHCYSRSIIAARACFLCPTTLIASYPNVFCEILCKRYVPRNQLGVVRPDRVEVAKTERKYECFLRRARDDVVHECDVRALEEKNMTNEHLNGGRFACFTEALDLERAHVCCRY